MARQTCNAINHRVKFGAQMRLFTVDLDRFSSWPSHGGKVASAVQFVPLYWRISIRRITQTLLLGMIVMMSARGEDSDPWRYVHKLDLNTASMAFQRRHSFDPGDLRLANAFAASLLARQPRTNANLDAARAVLSSVLKMAHRPADDDTRALALYLLARLDHEQVSPPRLVDARARTTSSTTRTTRRSPFTTPART